MKKILIFVIPALVLAACGAPEEKTTEAIKDSVTTTYGAGSEMESADTRVGRIEFENGYPTNESVEHLYDEIDFQRACQAYLWGLPMMATQAFVHSFKNDLDAEWGDFIEVKSFQDRSYGITANATTDYMFTWVNLEETGPVVIDVPAGLIAGFVSDLWQRAPADLGVPGKFGGKGEKRVLIGPGQEAPEGIDANDIIQSESSHNLILIRIIDPNPETKVQLREDFQVYTYATKDNPVKTKILPVGGKVWKTTQPQGFEYWEGMSEIINAEPIGERDRLIYATLAPLGIEKGKDFKPTERQRKILEEAAFVGEAMARTNGFETRHPDAEYAPDSQWDFPLVVSPTQRRETYDDLDGRAAWTYEALGISKGMTSRKVGVGSVYLGGYKDHDKNWLDGSNQYKLNIPKDPPAKNFWSLTLYHNVTRYLIQNETELADKSSRGEIDFNEDGSVDLYFGATAPEGKEKNWIQTVPGEGFFAYFRFYGPLQSHFDRTWILPDIEKTTW